MHPSSPAPSSSGPASLPPMGSRSVPSRQFVFQRVMAKVVDLLIFVALAALIPYPLGPLLGFLYSMGADALRGAGFRSQSVGKRLFRLRVVSRRAETKGNQQNGSSITIRDAFLRNAPVGVATFFGLIPLWGWVIMALVGLPLMAIEIYLMSTKEWGQRLGDVMGDTEVIVV